MIYIVPVFYDHFHSHKKYGKSIECSVKKPSVSFFATKKIAQRIYQAYPVFNCRREPVKEYIKQGIITPAIQAIIPLEVKLLKNILLFFVPAGDSQITGRQ
jgi:hypothetical protein